MTSSCPRPPDGYGCSDDLPVSNADPIATALLALNHRLDTLAQELNAVQAALKHLGALRSLQTFVPHDTAQHDSTYVDSPLKAPTLRLYCLGPFELFLNDHPVQRRPIGKGWTILKLLAARPREPVHREVLIETLWPQVDPVIANNRLRVAIHHLRSESLNVIGTVSNETVIQYHDGCYQLHPELAIWSDIEIFRTAWRAGTRAEQTGQETLAVDQFRQAMHLYRGDFLAEDPYEEWTLAPREELRDIYLTILDRLGRYALHAGDFASAQAHWRTLLRHDPWREDIYRQMIASCAVNGQRCQARQWYELCRQALRDQLGLPPEPETTQLIERILAGEEFCAQRLVD